ncbi:MAG: helix-turn-helix domain-containing protein [Candidatus Hydrogenedentes bacterium]|nr:helix-turn-helix domain-containing protein [Candidatus Hydrogenedentota bacterium]
MQTDKWLTLDELASYLKVSKSALYKMVQEGRIPGGKVGRVWRFDREEIDRWVSTRGAKTQEADNEQTDSSH